MLPLKRSSKEEGVCASVRSRRHPTLPASFRFRKSDPAAIQMVVPVGLVMALKPPEESCCTPAAAQAMTVRGGLGHLTAPFSGASLQSECLIKGT